MKVVLINPYEIGRQPFGLAEPAAWLTHAGDGRVQTEPVVHLSKIEFLTPDRSALPPLARYAHVQLPDGGCKTVGFAEGSRGCKHLCRYCPVVPVYRGMFRVIPVDVAIADVRQQVASGAQHISFGDPNFRISATMPPSRFNISSTTPRYCR